MADVTQLRKAFSPRHIAVVVCAVVSFWSVAAPGDASGHNIVHNPDFQHGLDGWSKWDPSGTLQASVVERHGSKALQMAVAPSDETGFRIVSQDLKLVPGKAYAVFLEIDAENAGGGAGPYYCIEYLDAAGVRTGLSTGTPLMEEGAWTPTRLNVVVPVTAAKTKIQLILHGHGTAWWRTISVTEIEPTRGVALEARVTARLAPKPNPRPLVGIGFEDDGYAYSNRNLGHGITPEELLLREARIRHLKPSLVRMFIWMGEWLPRDFFRTTPAPDYLWKTETVSNDLWQSRLKTLAQYQALGAAVNITGVEGGGIEYLGPMWEDPAKAARVYADLLEHLVKEKGFTCIKYFTLTNEPNAGFFAVKRGTFEAFETIHRLLREELKQRNLEISLVGSDDAGSYHFLAQCIESDAVRESAGIFSSHIYPEEYELNRTEVSRLFQGRIDLIERASPGKDLVIAEFGFSAAGGHGTAANELMKTYDYALYAADFMIDGLSHGVSGFTLWVLHQCYYPRAACDLMAYGMWGYRTAPGDVYPVFHALANFTRHTARGDTVIPVVVDGTLVRACMVGDTLFWANLRSTSVTFSVDGVSLLENCTYSENTLQGEGECGTIEAVTKNTCELLPRSFGRIRVSVRK